MNPRPFFRVLTLLLLLAALLPAVSARARIVENPPVRWFQLPWEQGKAWVALDGFDNGFKRPRSSPHHYLNGGAVDFTPYNGIRRGVDTSRFWVTAVAAGTVTEVGWCHLKLDHGNGWSSEYQFIANLLVRVGDSVHRNQKLAVIADGLRQPFCVPHVEDEIPHLHFSLRPTLRNIHLAGWLVEYAPLANWTTFTKGGVRVGSHRPLMNLPDLLIVLREPLAWNTRYTGSVDSLLYERWPLTLAAPTTFTVNITPQTGGLSLLLLLLDFSGNELARSSSGSLKAAQPPGSYFVQIQPLAGQGFYELIALREEKPLPTGPYVYTEPASPTIEAGQTMLTTVGLRNVPAGGFSSTEFTCTYDPVLVEVSEILPLTLFGPDPAIAIHDPRNGTFIVALAGSRGSRAQADGAAFTYQVRGLRAGTTTLECRARVSTGDGSLTRIEYLSAEVTIRAASAMQSTATALAATGADETAMSVLPPSAETPTAKVSAAPSTTLHGQDWAGKPALIRLYENEAPPAIESFPREYIVIAVASGCLTAQGRARLMSGSVTGLPPMHLLPGDLDGNNVIDAFDALPMGMKDNRPAPSPLT